MKMLKHPRGREIPLDIKYIKVENLDKASELCCKGYVIVGIYTSIRDTGWHKSFIIARYKDE